MVAAANTIRATYLMYREVKKYREHHKKKWAAGKLPVIWEDTRKMFLMCTYRCCWNSMDDVHELVQDQAEAEEIPSYPTG